MPPILGVLTQLNDGAKALLLFAAVLGVLAGFLRWARPRWKAAKADARAVRDTLVGRDAVVDSITGTEISPAVPGVGARMATQEQQMGAMAEAVAELVKSHRRIDDLESRVTAIEKGHHLERLVGKAESIQLYRAMEAVAHSDPPIEHDHPDLD